MRTIAFIAILIALTISTAAWAEDWPSQVSLGGFQITDVRGSANADGSGTATGTLQIPKSGNANISLTRSSRGDITGSASIDARGIRGSFTLSSSGLRGNGSVDCSPKPIEGASINISARGDASGSGKMSIGRLSAPVDFDTSGSSCNISGTAPVKAQIDTQVASYKFDGRLGLSGSSAKVSAKVSGKVERTGKLTKEVTTVNIPSANVNLSNGQCTVNVGGVSVTFSLF